MKVPYNDEKGSLTNITLKDICFAPLAPDNNECTITSVLNYFQNNVTRLKYQKNSGFFISGNASYHIHVCTRYVGGRYTCVCVCECVYVCLFACVCVKTEIKLAIKQAINQGRKTEIKLAKKVSYKLS